MVVPILGRDCWLSPGSVIDNGVRIGDKSLIGVNTHIRKNVENNSWYQAIHQGL